MTELGRIDSTGRSWSVPITVTLDNLHDICRRIHEKFNDKTYTVISEHSLYGTQVRKDQQLTPEGCRNRNAVSWWAEDDYDAIMLNNTYGVYLIYPGNRISFARDGFILEGESRSGDSYRWTFTSDGA